MPATKSTAKPRMTAKLATAEEIRSAGFETLTLPSGLTVQVRPVHPFDLARRGGELHNPLLMQIVSGAEPAQDNDPLAAASQLVELIDITCCCALVSPAMERDGTGDVLAPGDMAMGDRQAIFEWANRGAAESARFLAADDVAAVDDRAGVAGPPE